VLETREESRDVDNSAAKGEMGASTHDVAMIADARHFAFRLTNGRALAAMHILVFCVLSTLQASCLRI
jgi:hypothetical protein